MKQSLYWNVGSLCTLANTYSTALTYEQVAGKVLFPPCLILYSIITNKYDLTKKNGRIKQLLKENGHQESIISKSRITNLSWHVSKKSKRKAQISKRKRSE